MKKPDFSFHNLKASFSARSLRIGGYSVIITAIVLAIVVAVNVIAGALPMKLTKIDTTSNQLYSISQQSEDVLRGLKTDVTVYWVVRAGMESDMVEELLKKYDDISDRLKVVKKDPDLYPTFLHQYDLQTLSDNSVVVESDLRFSYVNYEDMIAVNQNYDSSTGQTMESYFFAGESLVTSSIDYVAKTEIPKMYVLTGHGEATLSAYFADAISKENIDTEELHLLTMDAVPEDADCILINGPKTDLSDEELTKLQDYISDGGNLMLLTDPPENGPLTNLETLMADYGVSAVEGVVIEADTGHFAYSYPHYLLPALNTHSITKPLMSGSYYALLPVAHGLTVKKELPAHLEVTKILTTSDIAFSKLAGYKLTTYEKEEGDIDGPFALGVAITDSSTDSNLVWISSTRLLNDDANSMVAGGNHDLFMNCLNWMCSVDGSGITIRAKSLSYDYLTINSESANVLTVLMVGLIPLTYLAIGIAARVRRSRR